MTYSNKFVFCVLVNGQPQKELANGQISLQFGVEYALRLRNKNNRRAVVEIWIDGENVSGDGYVINAHDYVDIKRHHDIDRAFKFVSLDSEDAIDFGKDGPNHDKVKGTIEARFRLEKERPQVVYRDVHHDHHHHHHHDHYVPQPWPYRPWYDRPIWLTNSNDNSGQPTYSDGMVYPTSTGGVARGMSCSSGGGGTTSSLSPAPAASNDDCERTLYSCDSIQKIDTLSFNDAAPLQDGCTVEGYSTGQTFRTVHIDLESAETYLKLFLVGFEEDVEEVAEVRKPSRKKRRTVKDNKVSDLQDENQRLRQELEDLKKTENLESENDRIKADINKEKSKKPAKKRNTKKKDRKGDAS